MGLHIGAVLQAANGFQNLLRDFFIVCHRIYLFLFIRQSDLQLAVFEAPAFDPLQPLQGRCVQQALVLQTQKDLSALDALETDVVTAASQRNDGFQNGVHAHGTPPCS